MKFKNLKANVIEDVSNKELIEMMKARPETYQIVEEKAPKAAKKEAKEAKK